MDELIIEAIKFSPVVAVLLVIMYFQQKRINQLSDRVDELNDKILSMLEGTFMDRHK